jgi:hypothetical protein
MRSMRRFVLGSRTGADTAVDEAAAGIAEAGAALLRAYLSRADVDRLARGGFRRSASDARVPVRNPTVKGPLAPTGEWLMEKAGRRAASIAITRVPRSDDVTYEIVNFIDGVRSVAEIRDAVSAEFQPVELGAVAEYIDLLASAAAVTYKP